MSFRGTPPDYGDEEETINVGGSEEYDDTLADQPEMPSEWYRGYGWACLVVGGLANGVQVVASAAGVVTIPLAWASITSLRVGSLNEAIALISSLPLMYTAALFLALVGQLFTHLYAKPLRAFLVSIKTPAQKKRASVDVELENNVKGVLCFVACVSNVLTDGLFATTLFGNPLSAVVWMLLVAGAATFLMYEGIKAVKHANEQDLVHDIYMEAHVDVLQDEVRQAYRSQYQQEYRQG